jgi:DNA-binding MarR family transcriptional regulator
MMMIANPDAPPLPLTDKQRDVLTIIARYYVQNQEPITLRLLARRLRCHHSTVEEHIDALYRKGWLPAPSAPRVRTSRP